MYDIKIEFADEFKPMIHERSTMDPHFENGFLMYVTPDKKARFINTDWIFAVTITVLDE